MEHRSINASLAGFPNPALQQKSVSVSLAHGDDSFLPPVEYWRGLRRVKIDFL